MKTAKELLQDENHLEGMLERARKGGIKVDSEEMKYPTRKPNTTDVPNEILDFWMPKLKESELKVLLYVVRKTYGYKGKEDGDFISLSQLLNGVKKKDGSYQDKGTGLGRTAILSAINILEDVGLIKVVRGREKEGYRTTNFYKLAIRDED